MSRSLAVGTWADVRLPRQLHSGAWWLWALGLAAAASRTTNPVLLGLIIAVAAYVVVARRTSAPWGGSFNAFLKLGLVVITIRVVFQALFGTHVGGSTVLFTLPELSMPAWAAGLKVGGRVTAEAVTIAFYDGLRLATILACLGAANALADARRLLRSVPGALYEAGVALVVAMTFAPRLVEDARRVQRAYRLRGRQASGIRALGRIAMPVLQGSLDRALELQVDWIGNAGWTAGPKHVHRKQLERFTVVSGTLGVHVDGSERVYGPGEPFEVAAGVPHQMAAEGPTRTTWEVRPALRTAEFFERRDVR
jgi:energy-coupling factor transport system permease protein